MKPLRMLLLLTSCTPLFGSLPENYQSLSAKEKRAILWENVSKDAYTVFPKQNTDEPQKPLCPLVYGFDHTKALFSPSWLAIRFTHQSDEMPPEDDGLQHPKSIHTYGSVAMVRWKPVKNDSPFSGLFASGGIGLMRASLAAPYGEDGPYLPGMALKFLRDGKPSANFHVMFSLDGQGTNKNFFANNFTNVLAPANSWKLWFIEKFFFSKAIRNHMEHGPSDAKTLPLSEAAEFYNSGKASDPVVEPYRVVFVPTNDAKNLISANAKESDIRKQLARARFDLNKPIYTIYAQAEKGELILIGELYMESKFVASEYGDQTLFFKHQRFLFEKSDS